MGTDGCVRESECSGVNVPNIVSVVSANSGMLAQCNPLNELSISVYKDSSKQVVTQFLRELDSYFQIKGTPEKLRLPLAIQAIEDKFAQEWISAIRHKLQSYDEFREQFSKFLWNDLRQAQVKVSIYQDKFDRRSGESMASCLNKLINHYFIQVTKPIKILSDNGTQFQSPAWKRALTSHGVQARYTAIRNPQSNPAERCMREISKFSRIYCHETHKRWAELVPHMEFWMNNTLASPTGYTPSEIMFDAKKPSLFNNILPKVTGDESVSDELRIKISKAYERMKKRIEGRKRKKGNAHWKLDPRDKVLLKTQPVSDAAMAVTSKFKRPYEGPYLITKVIHPSTYELADEKGKIRGQFNKRSLKPYKVAVDTVGTSPPPLPKKSYFQNCVFVAPTIQKLP
jgi:hypothetical protein